MIKAVLFDIDGVLINTFEANLKFFQDLMKNTGYPEPTREEYRKLFHRTMIDTVGILSKSESKEEVQRIYSLWHDRSFGYPTELVTSPPKMKETIAELSQKYILGLVTSRVKRNIFETDNMKEIEQYFQDIVAVNDTDKHKPDPEPLLLMLEKLEITANEAIYIWDSESDFLAAQAAGMPFILFPRKKVEWVSNIVDNFEELPKMISGIDK